MTKSEEIIHKLKGEHDFGRAVFKWDNDLEDQYQIETCNTCDFEKIGKVSNENFHASTMSGSTFYMNASSGVPITTHGGTGGTGASGSGGNSIGTIDMGSGSILANSLSITYDES